MPPRTPAQQRRRAQGTGQRQAGAGAGAAQSQASSSSSSSLAQREMQRFSQYEQLQKRETLAPALGVLQGFNLISEPEDQMIRRLELSSKESQVFTVLNSEIAQRLAIVPQEPLEKNDPFGVVSGRLQAYLNDDENTSRQRKQVRNAKSVVDFHRDLRARYQALVQLDREREEERRKEREREQEREGEQRQAVPQQTPQERHPRCAAAGQARNDQPQPRQTRTNRPDPAQAQTPQQQSGRARAARPQTGQAQTAQQQAGQIPAQARPHPDPVQQQRCHANPTIRAQAEDMMTQLDNMSQISLWQLSTWDNSVPNKLRTEISAALHRMICIIAQSPANDYLAFAPQLIELAPTIFHTFLDVHTQGYARVAQLRVPHRLQLSIPTPEGTLLEKKANRSTYI